MDVNGIDNLRQQKDAMTASLKENMDFLNRKLDLVKNSENIPIKPAAKIDRVV